MTLDEYQREAARTDQQSSQGSDGLVIPLLGLAGETGSLITLYKKCLRDGTAYQIIDQRISEELGDVLWYVATISRRAGINLSEIARYNLQKTQKRWLDEDQKNKLFDEDLPDGERLPRSFVAEIRDFTEGNRTKTTLLIDGVKAGDHLTDNAYTDDGYRFHDVFHLAYATLLGWSPVLRAGMRRKRKSKQLIDEVEDGGRAIAIEEGISALVFTYAEKHSFLENVRVIDWGILRTCHEMASHLEVSERSLHAWEKAILAGYEVWRAVRNNKGGLIKCDLEKRILTYVDG